METIFLQGLAVGMSTWFILPDFFTKDLKDTGLLEELLKAKEELRKYKYAE